MWLAELKVWHSNALQLDLSKKFSVTLTSYYLNVFKEGKNEYVSKALNVMGKDKEAFLDELQKDSRVKHFRVEGNQAYFCIAPQKIFHNAVLDKSIFFVKPILVKNGFEYWSIASWDKRAINNLISKIKKTKRFATVELISLKKSKLNFFMPNIFNNLTEKQINAIVLAYENGYYDQPRKINVKQLAVKTGFSRSTLQEHLRKCEGKLLKAVLEQLPK